MMQQSPNDSMQLKSLIQGALLSYASYGQAGLIVVFMSR